MTPVNNSGNNGGNGGDDGEGSAPECSQSALVEALHDGRLGPQERASVERHAAGCAACAALARDLGRIGEALRAPLPPATPLEHQRARHALLRRAAELPATGNPRGKVYVVLAAAALAAALALGWFGGRLSADPERPAVALHLHLDPHLALGRETTIRPSDDARFERSSSAGLDVVTLASGGLDVTVRPLATGERFVVRTSDAEIEVRGRAFHVEAEQGRIRSVAVANGTVEVRYAGFTAVIPSGGSWKATGELAPLPVTMGPQAAPNPGLLRSPGTIELPVKSVAVAAPAPVKIVALAAPAPVRVRRTPPITPPAPVESAAPTPPAPPSAAPLPPPASHDFAEAMRALSRGDYDGSAAQLQAFAALHPSDTRADEAEYLHAIALQRAGHAADAAAAAKRYLDARPEGAHRIEARKIAGD